MGSYSGGTSTFTRLNSALKFANPNVFSLLALKMDPVIEDIVEVEWIRGYAFCTKDDKFGQAQSCAYVTIELDRDRRKDDLSCFRSDEPKHNSKSSEHTVRNGAQYRYQPMMKLTCVVGLMLEF